MAGIYLTVLRTRGSNYAPSRGALCAAVLLRRQFYHRIIKLVAARHNFVWLVVFFLQFNLEIITDRRASGGFWHYRIRAFRRFGG